MARHTVILIPALLLATINGTVTARICKSSAETWQSHIGILISPIMSDSRMQEIEIYWNNVNLGPDEKIVLMKENNSSSSFILYNVTSNESSGVEKTGIRTKFLPSSNLSFVQRSSKYYVAVLTTTGNVKETNYLKTNPTWMKERKHILSPLRMSQIFLPGTHDSACYAQENITKLFVSKYAVTQNMDILGQLIHGVRYLDIRVGSYPFTKEHWWTNHGPFYRSVSLQTVIDQVKKFLENTEEIVILDIREFPIGFDDISVHRELVSYLEDQFRDYFLTSNSGWAITMNDIWSSGKRLIIGYENMQIVREHASMWPCVRHQWGNVRSIEDLYKYLDKIENEDSDYRVRPRSAMAELTMNVMDVIYNRLGNLRDMAHRVNVNVTNWYSTVWQYTANIVAVDFVRGTGMVEAAIKSNENRHLHCRY
ncbi:PI-PLC X domain-containing protein 1-like [Colletes gigas]|uniref:PI-PLC X domain-containing protein 1-like n=1 Tax=Colletes gigas TaxID=935657 RepID=UPI001C9B8107|nr:PI-PLC X domain-containing protein 1-like [Colletes gigas]XP_043251645.1 PI-PLC X domain-containing protein 1-like [Colletes gigas]